MVNLPKIVFSQAGRAACVAGLLLMVINVSAQSSAKVESSRAVTSPDGKRTVVVDRFSPVVDGQVERFSGQMLIRVTSADGSPAKQRYIEASQARVIQPPVWIDDSRVCAFVYNVAKNSNGIVYFEPEINRAVQVEFVMPTRRMAASGKAEQELTSLEVMEFSGANVLKTRNVPWNGGSAFPLVLPPLPPFDGRPYDMEFLNQLDASIADYKDFLKRNNIAALEPEQASESFSDDGRWLGLLACAGGDSCLAGVPLTTGTAAGLKSVKLVKVKGIGLSCAQHAAGDASEATMHESRYLTAWKNPETLQIIKETYGAESDTPETTAVLSLNVTTGAIDQLAATDDTPTSASKR